MADTPELQAESGVLAGQRWAITDAGIRVGREPENEVFVDDPAVSRQHARVLLHNGAVWVQDAGSRNGVFVNGERVADHKQVKPGDRVTVGTHLFKVVMGPDAPSPAPAAAPAPAPLTRSTPPAPRRKASLLPWLVGGMGLVLVAALAFVVIVVALQALGLFG